MRVRELLHLFMIPGIVIHEVAHALVVVLLPNIEVVSIDLTSHVEHRGHYTLLDTVLISYAPLFVNTAVAFWALLYVASLQLTSLRTVALAVGLSYVAVVAGMTAIPSWTDVTNPLTISWRQLLSIRGIAAMPFIVVLLLLSLPWLAISYARKESFVLYFLASIGYATIVIFIAFGIIPLPSTNEVVTRVVHVIETAL